MWVVEIIVYWFKTRFLIATLGNYNHPTCNRFINRVADHPDLQSDPSFVDFLEVDGDLPRATSTSALSGAGVMRLFNRVGDSIMKTTLKVDETDQVCACIVLMNF